MRSCERAGFKCETYTGLIEGGSRFWCVSTHAQDPQRFSLRILETGRPLRKVEAQQNGRTLLLEEIGAVVTLGCTRDHELELEFLAECDCAPDLAHGVGLKDHSQFAVDYGLQCCKRVVDLWTGHSAFGALVTSPFVTIVLRVEQGLTQERKDSHERAGI